MTGMAVCGFLISALGLGATAPGPGRDVRRDATVEAVELAMPSVVNILTKARVEQRGYFYDWFRNNWAPFVRKMPPQTSAGSGVIIDEDGYVLTNVHVVEGADEVWVKLMDDRPPLRAVPIVGSRRGDVALLQIQAKPGQKFQGIRFAQDDDLLLGETVLALGNPFGLGGSVSKGILSAKSRRATERLESELEIPDWLQTDAAINPGNSGGPLINLRGEMIGINVAVMREGQGIGFAIPIKQVNESLSHLLTPEWLKDLWFGARIKPGTGGFAVSDIQPGSPAEQGSLKVGDLILRVNGKTPASLAGLVRELCEVGPSHQVSVQVQRDQTRPTLEIRLIPKKSVFNAGLIRQKSGLVLQSITEEQAAELGLETAEGYVITAVDRDSPAAAAGLKAGYVIRAIDGQIPGDLMALAERLYQQPKGEPVELQILAQRQRGRFVELRRATVSLMLR